MVEASKKQYAIVNRQNLKLLLASEDEQSVADSIGVPVGWASGVTTRTPTPGMSTPLTAGLHVPASPSGWEQPSPATVASERLAVQKEARIDRLRGKCLRLISEREEAVAQRFGDASLVLEQSLEIDTLGTS